MRSTLTSKGQTTIPKAIRDHLNLRPGQRIDYVVEEGGKVVLKPASYDLSDLAGSLHRADGPTLTVEQMSEVVRERGARG